MMACLHRHLANQSGEDVPNFPEADFGTTRSEFALNVNFRFARDPGGIADATAIGVADS
jgi:hypothetical protein